jgi:ADP-heptose:LPS heptosyltransferase
VTRRLVARLDNVGDVLLAGPTVRAVAASGDEVVFLAGPGGAAAARLLPGVDSVITYAAPWVGFDGHHLDVADHDRVVAEVAAADIDEALILTSFHQSALPLSLMLRLAGVRRTGAVSVDFPGTLLDVRHPWTEHLHEVEQGLSLAAAMGHRLPPGDDGRLRITWPLRPGIDHLTTAAAGLPDGVPARLPARLPDGGYVVVHPGASVPARGLPEHVARDVVAALCAHGHHVVVTAGRAEVAVAHRVASTAPADSVSVLAGTTDLVCLARVIAGADAIVCGNTGPAHLAAAVGTPVVQAFAPVVAPHRWTPWKVPSVVLGRLDIECAGCRSRTCDRPGQPCLDPFTPVRGARGRRPARRPTYGCIGGVGLGGGGRVVNVLIWHVHGSWTTNFVQGEHTYLVPVTPDRGPDGRGRAMTWDWPTNVVECTPQELADCPIDVVIVQRPEELDLCASWTRRHPGRDLPLVWLEHNAPQGRVNEMQHPARDRDDCTVVHVTHTNRLFWDTGSTRTTVIEHGVIDPGHRWTGDEAAAGVVVNEPVRRGRVAGTDLLPLFGAVARVDVFGMGVESLVPEFGGPAWLRVEEDLPQSALHDELARRRCYVHPFRWTSLGLSLIEAMLLGVPVVALATTDVVEAVPRSCGTVSNDLDVLVAAVARAVDEQQSDAAAAARAHALERYSLDRFLTEWNDLLEETCS